jgi:hypothetical protein
LHAGGRRFDPGILHLRDDRANGSCAMAVMIAEVYEALKEAGASEAKARAAAESLANYESRFSKIEADLLVIKWMLGVVIAGILSIMVKAFLT